MPIKNYKARLSPDQYAAKIMQCLATKGARAVTVQYESNVPSGLSFVITVKGMPISFLLPCNVDGVKRCLAKTNASKSDEHATRVAWAIVKDWVEAQMAVIEAGQVTMEQVFLPYAVIRDGFTAFDLFLNEASRQKTLRQ